MRLIPGGITDVLAQNTSEVVVMGPIIKYDLPLPRLLAMYSDDEKISPFRKYSEIRELDAHFKRGLADSPARYISILDLICPTESECTKFDEGGDPLQFDAAHLTHEGALKLVHLMEERKLLRTPAVDDR